MCTNAFCKLHSLNPADFALIFTPKIFFVREVCANMRNSTEEFRSNLKG